MEDTTIARQSGVVKFFNETKGYGFITCTTGVDYFVHSSNIEQGALNEKDNVTFIVTVSERNGKDQATKVRLENS